MFIIGLSATWFLRVLLALFYGGCFFLEWREIPTFIKIWANPYATLGLASVTILLYVPWRTIGKLFGGEKPK